MVVFAGYNPNDGILVYSDAIGKNVQRIETLKLSDKDENKIIDLFKDIDKKVNKNIQSICVKLGSNYKNKFRKTFINVANSCGIKTVKFIGRQIAMLHAAFTCIPSYKEKEGVIWIFEIFKNIIYCNIWERKENDIWRFKNRFKQEKEIKQSSVFAESEDLLALKDKLTPAFDKPLILVCCDYFNIEVQQKSEFKKIFTNNQNIFISNRYLWSFWALKYVRNNVVSELLLERNISVVTDNTMIIENDYFHKIPSESSFTIPVEYVDLKLKVFEDGIDTETMKFGTTGISEIRLIVDENELFFVSSRPILNEIKDQQLQIDYNQTKNKKCYSMPAKIVEYNRDSNAVGIDFGTTECCAAVIRPRGPDCVVLDNTTALRTMPSYVSYDGREPIFGQLVINRMRRFEKCTVFDTKRMLGKNFDEIAIDTSWPFTVQESQDKTCQIELEKDGKIIKLSPEEVSASLLKHIKNRVDEYQHKKLKEAVIAVPSAFTEKQKDALLKVTKLAGWETIHFIPEPIAAAFAYSTEIEIPDNSNLLLFDLGGGTVDVCIVRILSGNLQVLSFDGNYYLGGRDFDTLLYNHFVGILKHKHNIDVMAANMKYVLLKACQDIKHTLSAAENHWLDVDVFDSNSDETIEITVQEFNSMAADNMTKIANVILRALKKANLRQNEIDFVVQVGGSSRMPMIKKRLMEMFPASIHECCKYPQWVVSEGAALYAYYLEHKEK